MKRLNVIAAALVVGVLAIGVLAWADKTTTQLTSGSHITSLQFDLQSQPGKVVAVACGRAPLVGGGFSQPTCHLIILTSGSIFTSVNSLAAGGALTFWQQEEGL